MQTQQYITTTDPFYERFGLPLPTGLKEQASGISWATFTDTFAPIADLRVRINSTTQLRGTLNEYNITLLQRGQQREEHTIVGAGAALACTQLLAERGRRIEILQFHQRKIFESTATFILAGNDVHSRWAMGFGGTPEQSIAAALSTAGELLYGRRS
ncbi:NAD(P)/FAD-dependent oxidoreductase [Corynebacterium gerontici]|uniref:2-isopropylmalate synthase LeuA allosteric (dimerisation) domain-containing protein n=1 Tax=Corynebacterium gerontici TaxID=2079234 RepID=A0A3G6J3F4_9CORY|nr:NAD(P)/FAD-dependent oxidoreductase [Corynebacterium gerontici]AZA10644.1 hypothetical protein CGERO_01550 [Corynebacterium gerontici]